MKKIAGLIAFVVFPAFTLLASAFVFQGSDDAARGVAIELFKSLDEQQKSEALNTEKHCSMHCRHLIYKYAASQLFELLV